MAENTRERLIRVGSELFAERGFDGVSVRDIIGRAGANLGAVTYHFGSKEGLFAAVIAHKIQPLREIGMRVAASSFTPEEKLRTILLESSMHILNKDPSLKAFFAESMQGGDRLPAEAVEAIKQRNKLVAGAIQEGIDQGVFRPCDANAATWIFFGMIAPYVLHEPLIKKEFRSGPYPREYVERIVNTALDLFLHGIKTS